MLHFVGCHAVYAAFISTFEDKTAEVIKMGINIFKISFWGYIVRYMVGYHYKLNFRLYIRRYTFTNVFFFIYKTIPLLCHQNNTPFNEAPYQ